MFLFKRLISFLAPLITSQLFWFILVQKNWYYWWLLIWLVAGSLILWLIVGLGQKQHWAFLAAQYILITIMPALMLTLVPNLAFQAILTVFLAAIAMLYYYFVFQKYLLKEVPIWWLPIWRVILALNLIFSSIVIYGLVEFLNFSVWLSGLFIVLLFGFFVYFQEVSPDPSLLAKVVGGIENLMGWSSSAWIKQFKAAAIVSLLGLELFLAIWLLPIIFYFKGLLLSFILIFWISQPHPQHKSAYWWKWLLGLAMICLILILARWF